VVSPTDAAVLDLQQRIAQEVSARSRVEGERSLLEARMKRAQRVAAVEREFQVSFPEALAHDADAVHAGVERLTRMQTELAQVKRELFNVAGNAQPRSASALQREFDARLIDEQRYARETYQLAQLARDRYSLQEKASELDERIRREERELNGLRAAGKGRYRGAGGYDALLRERERARSVVESKNADDEAEALQLGLERLTLAVAEHDALLETLRASPLLKASSDRLHLAFVPYDNQENAPVGSPVFACRFGAIGCHAVGHIRTYLEGEHEQPHPVYGRNQRGQLVELSLDEPEAIREGVLHTKRPPLLL